MAKDTKLYKIQRKSNNDEYVKGTPVYHSYDKTGRIFQGLGSLRSFLTNVMNNSHKSTNIHDWQIVEIEMRVADIKEIHEVVKPEKIVTLLKA